MAKDVADFQRGHLRCQEFIDVGESRFTQETEAWRQPYLDFFQQHLLPFNHTDAMKLQRESSRFFVKDGFFYVEEALTKHLLAA